MRFVFCYAGITAGGAYDYVEKMKLSLTGDNTDYIGIPIGRGRELSDAYAHEIMELFKVRLGNEFNTSNNFATTSYAVIYVRGKEDIPHSNFEEALFPSILTIPVKWEQCGLTPDERAVSHKRLFKELLHATKRARMLLKVVHDQLKEQANKTPLLLPLENFQSTKLKPWLKQLQSSLAAQEDEINARGTLKKALVEWEQHHPRRPVKDFKNKKPAFHDDREIEFRAPGIGGMHGLPHLKSEHPSSRCLLGAYRRLGAPFNAAFHYDVQKDSPRKIKSNFCSCHGPLKLMEGDPHLNVAPNDFIRK